MQIKLAKTAGFCFGVNRAINMAKEAVEENKNLIIFSLGPLIHNKQVVEEFQQKGVRVIDSIEDVEENSLLIIRAHGVSPEIYKKIESKNLKLIDTTCPFVKKIHIKVSECTEDGNRIVIVGDKLHPEVIGIKGWDPNAIVIDSEEEAEKLILNEKVCVVAQTTISYEKWDKICTILKTKISDCKIYNTICNATMERQKEAQEIAKEVDSMIIIGDPHSSNTQKLYQISKNCCSQTFLVENSNQLNLNILKEFNKIGVTAGASTPDRIIKEVIDKMSEINDVMEEEVNFEELFDKSMKSIEEDEIIKGKVIGVSNKEVFVDIGYKADGIIPIEEFSDNPEEKPTDIYKVGDEIEVYVVKVNDGEGNVLLSRKRLEYTKGWEKIVEAFEKGIFVSGFVSDVVNGGVLAVVNGIKVFIPASQLGEKYVEDLNQYRKKPVTIKIIDLNQNKKKVVGSQRAVLQLEREAAKKDLWEHIQVGQEVKGVVKRLTDFGVFVDIGGADGLIHISELSWNRIKHPSEVVKEGQEVEVRIIDIDQEKKKISLGYKKTVDDPWNSAIKEYEVGQVVKGKVVNLMQFGAFIEIQPGLTGLVHISQISNKRITKPQEVLSLGQEVEAKITAIDLEKKKISLSIRELLPIIEVETKEVPADAPEEEIQTEHKEDLGVTLGDLVSQEETKSEDESNKE